MAPSPDPFQATLDKGRREAFGFVTIDSIAPIHEPMRRLFFAEHEHGAQNSPRLYTKVCAYEYAGYRPEVWTSQEVVEPLRVSTDDGYAAVHVSDTYGVWSISTRLEFQPRYGDDEALRKGMYLVISDQHLQAHLRTPEGRLAWWHVQLERETQRG